MHSHTVLCGAFGEALGEDFAAWCTATWWRAVPDEALGGERAAWCCAAAENCIVVAEGALQHNGVFRVDALGFPPPEARAESQAALKARRPEPEPSTQTLMYTVKRIPCHIGGMAPRACVLLSAP